MDLIDLRIGAGPPFQQVQRVLGDALHNLEWGGFLPTVLENLRLVAATNRDERAIPSIQGYYCNFETLGWDRIAIACRLVWFAKYYELTRVGSRQTSTLAVARGCFEAEKAFVSKLPDAARWIAFLEAHHDPDASI